MTMNLDRSIPGRVYVDFGAGTRGALARESTFGPNGQVDGRGVNVSAFGTLRPSELRDLARLLVAEADALEPGRDHAVELIHAAEQRRPDPLG